MKCYAPLVAACCFLGLAHAAGLDSFSPQGEHLQARQAEARFSAAMVPQGRGDAPAPFLVQCGVPGTGYWVDERTWSYSLQGDLKAGEICRFIPRPGLATLTGETVQAAPEYSFSSAGPRVVWLLPQPGSALDEDQVFLSRINGQARPESILAHARCEIQGIHERVAVKRLLGAERTRLLKELAPTLNDSGVEWQGQGRR
jgi:hypothetical protein